MRMVVYKKTLFITVVICIQIKMIRMSHFIILTTYWSRLTKKSFMASLLTSDPFWKLVTKTNVQTWSTGSYRVFKKVMNFVNTGSITLDMNTVLEIWHLATYLQIDCLLEICLDHFTLNLNRHTLEPQLNFMKNCSFLDREFRERALMFEKSGSPAFSGLYFCKA